MSVEEGNGSLLLVIRSVDSLPPIYNPDEVRADNGASAGVIEGADWLAVAEASVEAVRGKSSWSIPDWCEKAATVFPPGPDRSAFEILLASPMSVNDEDWYDGQHRAICQIDAGATEIVLVAPGYQPFVDE